MATVQERIELAEQAETAILTALADRADLVSYSMDGEAYTHAPENALRAIREHLDSLRARLRASSSRPTRNYAGFRRP